MADEKDQLKTDRELRPDFAIGKIERDKFREREANKAVEYRGAECGSAAAQLAPMGISSARRPGINERIRVAIIEGEASADRYRAARRAMMILEQHPEFAELLDLLERI